MLAVIIINVLLAVLVLGAIVGSHLWAILSSGEPQPKPQPLTGPQARAHARNRRRQTAAIGRSATATR